jgi:hypothetical protein
MENILNDVLGRLNFLYIFICNIATYIIITCIPKDLSTIMKRIISTVVAAGLGIVFWRMLDNPGDIIFCSFFVQYLMYDYVIKWLKDKVNK